MISLMPTSTSQRSFEVTEQAHSDDEPHHGRWKQLALPLGLAAVLRDGLLDHVARQDLCRSSGPKVDWVKISDSSVSCSLGRIGYLPPREGEAPRHSQ